MFKRALLLAALSACAGAQAVTTTTSSSSSSSRSSTTSSTSYSSFGPGSTTITAFLAPGVSTAGIVAADACLSTIAFNCAGLKGNPYCDQATLYEGTDVVVSFAIFPRSLVVLFFPSSAQSFPAVFLSLPLSLSCSSQVAWTYRLTQETPLFARRWLSPRTPGARTTPSTSTPAPPSPPSP